MSEQRIAVGVRFKEAGKVYYFDAGEYSLDVGNYVVVETSHGLEIGRVVISPDQVIASDIKETLKPILRIASAEDLKSWRDLKDRAEGNLRFAKSHIARNGPEMQLVSAEYNLEGTQLTLYFTAGDRIDFRHVNRVLADEFQIKVQMLQVGDRDRAKLLDGYDVCGQRLCCASWQTNFPAVSIKMAKEQDLPLNPQKISGVCGRLYCCLTFEYEGYREIRGTMPKVGALLSTPSGEAKVRSINAMKKTVSLWLTEAHQVIEMPAAELQMQHGLTVRPVELVAEIEAPLKAAPVSDAAPAPADAAVAEDAPAASAGIAAEGDAARKRRRGRRGGRNRKREDGGGGPPPASGE